MDRTKYVFGTKTKPESYAGYWEAMLDDGTPFKMYKERRPSWFSRLTNNGFLSMKWHDHPTSNPE